MLKYVPLIVVFLSRMLQVYNKRIETEGLAAMAKSLGIKSYGLPNVEIIHK